MLWVWKASVELSMSCIKSWMLCSEDANSFLIVDLLEGSGKGSRSKRGQDSAAFLTLRESMRSQKRWQTWKTYVKGRRLQYINNTRYPNCIWYFSIRNHKKTLTCFIFAQVPSCVCFLQLELLTSDSPQQAGQLLNRDISWLWHTMNLSVTLKKENDLLICTMTHLGLCLES